MASFTSADPAPDDVVISGIGGTFPQSKNLDEFGNNLLDNNHMVQDIPISNWHRDKLGVPRKRGSMHDKDKFDTAFFGISQALTSTMDPTIWRILENTFEAIIDSGFNPSDLRNTNTAVIMGALVSEYESLRILSHDIEHGLGLLGHSRSMTANRVSYWLNLKGPSFAYYAEESAGIMGLEIAQQLITKHQCDAAIVGTVNLAALLEATSAYMGLGCLSSDGKCCAFDANGTGYAKSEACVIMYLQRAKNAKRIYATVVHAETSYNGNRNSGFVRPICDQMVQFLEHFYEKCGVDPTQIAYLEASACGLQIYEEAELKALSKVLLSKRKSPLLIGSVKSNMGQAGAASSACSIAKLLVAMERGVIPANLNFETPGPHIPALTEGRLKVVSENTKWSPGLVAVNSIDMTGYCGHVVLRPCSKVKSTICGINDKLPRLICLSGRNEEATQEIIEKIKVKASDDDFIRLVQDVYSSNITNHNYRGYIVTSDSCKTEKKYFDGSKLPVWFVFSGMGSQWPGMATHLMKLPIIADTLQQCHAILQPKGVDLMAILTHDDPRMFDNILHSFVGIAAVQIALVETLRLLNIQPDGLIGHSVGELGCAYADGCFTMEQMILAAYYRGLASLEAELIQGRMAAIGMGYKKLKDLVPPSIDIACHNSDESSTISGPADAITPFISELSAKYIFAKEVNVANIAYHSRYIKPAAPKLLEYLRNVIPEPKPRSPRWYSTSVPEELWDTDEARYSSAEYHTNNLLNPVLFEEASKHIPKNAILIEIAPHGLLQAILTRSMRAECINIPLTQRGNEQGLEFLLSAVGRLYLAGIVPRISALYPPVQFPVSRGTPSTASLATWDHSTVRHITDDFIVDVKRPMKTNFNLTLNDESCRILKDYMVNGHIILPAAAVLVLVWKEFGNSISRNFSKMPVVFESMYFYYIPVFTVNGSLDLNLFLQRATGNFELCETGNYQIFAKGQVRTVKDISAEFSTITEYDVTDGERLTSHDIYTELENRGFEYGEQFCKIREATLYNQGSKALIDWCDHWVVAIDSLLQLVTLQSTEGKQDLHMPMFMQKVVIDPCGETATSNKNGNVALFHKFTNTARCESIEIRGVKTKGVHMEQSLDVKMCTITFIPFKKSQFQSPCEFADRAIQLLLQNKSATSKSTVTLTVLVNEKTTKGIDSKMENVFKENNNIKVLMNTLSVSDNQNKSNVETGNLLLASDSTVDQGIMLIRNHGGFLFACVSSDKDIKLHKDVAIIDEQCFEDKKWIFMKKCAAVTNSTTVVFLPKVERLKPYEDFAEETTTKKYVVSENYSLDEIKAFVADITTGKIHSQRSYRFVFIVDSDAPPFCPTSSFYTEQLQLDLMMNIYYNGSWGSLTDSQVPCMPATQHSSFSKLVSSLRVKDIEWSFAGVHLQNLKTLKLEEDQSHVLDMSGYTVDGRKVMCVAHTRPGHIQATTASHLTWEVPDAWSEEDTATVPLAYSMAYYALVLRAAARSGENILIQAGHTHIGQAFISVALQKGLVVCTTVSNKEHRMYLRKKFPQILDSDIYDLNSRYLEGELLKRSGNNGFRLVVNPLEEHFLQLSANCAGWDSRLLQLCTTQMEQNKTFGMKNFMKNLSVISVIPEMMFEMNQARRTRLHEMMAEGIKTGVVQPLDREVFTVVKVHEILSTLHDLNCTKKVLITKNSHPKTMFSFDDKVSCLIVGDAPENCLVYAEWLASRGCRYITLCCNSSAMSGLNNRHIRILRKHNNVNIDVISLEKTNTLEHTMDLLRGINTITPLAAIFMLSVKNALSVHLLELALCETELGTPSVVLTNCNTATVKHMRKSTGLPVLDLQMSSKVKGTKLRVLLRFLDDLLLSKPNESVYLSIKEKHAPQELLSSEEQLSILLPSSVEQLERLGEDLMLNTSCTLEEVCSKSPCLSHVKEVLPVFIIPGLHGPAKSTTEVLARNLMYPAVIVKLPGQTHSLQDDIAAIISVMKRIQPKGPYNLVGISWGGMYTIELAKQLQAKGDKTQVFLLEGAPQTNQDIARLLGDGDQLQVNLLIRLLNLTPRTVLKDLLSLPDWSSRVHRALAELPHMSVLSKQYLSCAVEALYRRVETLLQYKPDGKLLSGQVVLIRPNTQPHDGCGLEEFFKESLNTVLVDGDHKSLLEILEVADIISDLALVDLYWIGQRG